MNRAERRKQQKAVPGWMRNLSSNEALTRMAKNGITAQDMLREYRRGYTDGSDEAQRACVRLLYAAACVAARRAFRFGKKRIRRLMRAMDEALEMCIDDADMVAQAEQETGYKLRFRGDNGSVIDWTDEGGT